MDFDANTIDINLDFGAGTLLVTEDAVAMTDFWQQSAINLIGSGEFQSGNITGAFVGPQYEGIMTVIEAMLSSDSSIVRGSGIFDRDGGS